MRNIWAIVKVNLFQVLLNTSLVKRRRKAKIGAGGSALFAFAIAAYLLFIFYNNARMMAETLMPEGALSLLLSGANALSTLLVISMAIYKMPTYLFHCKDYDLLMSLPIKPYQIIVGKIIPLWVVNVLYTFLFAGGSLFVYGQVMQMGAVYYAFSVLAILLIPLFPMVVGGILALLIDRVSKLLKAEHLITTIISLIIMIAVVGVSLLINSGSYFSVSFMRSIYATVDCVLFPAKFLIPALVEQNGISMLFYAAGSILLFLLLLGIFGKNFKRINTGATAHRKSTSYRKKDLSVSTPFQALLKKELSLFFNSTNYFLNSSFGLILYLISGIVMLFLSERIMNALPGKELFLSFAVTTLLLNMSTISACSISMEGRRILLIKSFPISEKILLRAKGMAHVLITLPAAVIGAILYCIAFRVHWAEAIMLIIFGIVVTGYQATLGIMFNLRHPKVIWKNEIEPIKQSMSVLLTVLSGIGTAFALIAAGGFFMMETNLPVVFVVAAATGVLFAIALLIWVWVEHRGIKRFLNIQI